jgi:hypothetical protein
MPTIKLPVPNWVVGSGGPIYGAWVDVSGVGIQPQGQLDEVATSADVVTMETAADPAAVVGVYVAGFAGGIGSYQIEPPIALARAVRQPPPAGAGATTAGISLNLSQSNQTSRGPAGPSGVSVQCTLRTNGVGGISIDTGQTGVVGTPSFVTVAGVKQILVTFATAFPTPSYSVLGGWFNPAIAPAPLNPFAMDTPPVADGRTTATLTFALWNPATLGLVDPTDNAVVIMLTLT